MIIFICHCPNKKIADGIFIIITHSDSPGDANVPRHTILKTMLCDSAKREQPEVSRPWVFRADAMEEDGGAARRWFFFKHFDRDELWLMLVHRYD